MPETFSNGNRSNSTQRKSLPWFSATLDWPYETVVLEAKVVSARKPNVLEWAVIRILEDFQDSPPTLTEAAEQLAIMEPAFLTDTIGRLAEGGIIELDDTAAEVEFTHCHLTPKAREFLSVKQDSKFFERHGLKLCFDSVTGTHLPQPPRYSRPQPQYPVIPAAQLSDRQTHLGLDRTRQWAQEQNEPFLAANSEIKEVRVLEEQGSIHWTPLRIEVSIDSAGTILITLPTGTPQQQLWFDQLEANHPSLNRLLEQAILPGWPPDTLPETPLTQWWSRLERIIPADSLESQVLELIRSAQREVLLHRLWLDEPAIMRALQQAATRQVRCRYFGAGPDLQSEFLENIAPSMDAQATRPVVLMVDAQVGLSLDAVTLHTSQGRQLRIIIPSRVLKTHAVDWYQQILDQANVV